MEDVLRRCTASGIVIEGVSEKRRAKAAKEVKPVVKETASAPSPTPKPAPSVRKGMRKPQQDHVPPKKWQTLKSEYENPYKSDFDLKDSSHLSKEELYAMEVELSWKHKDFIPQYRKYGDPILLEYAERRWGSQASRVVSHEEFMRSGKKHAVMYRGLEGKHYTMSNVEGKFVGTGKYLNGLYFAAGRARRDVAKYSYGNMGERKDAWVYAARVSDDAKLIDYDDLLKIYDEEMTNYGVHLDNYVLKENVGRYAASKGYDGVVMQSVDSYTDRHYVMFNRSKVIVDESSLPGGQIDAQLAAEKFGKSGEKAWRHLELLDEKYFPDELT